jgi:hypothetical protein
MLITVSLPLQLRDSGRIALHFPCFLQRCSSLEPSRELSILDYGDFESIQLRFQITSHLTILQLVAIEIVPDRNKLSEFIFSMLHKELLLILNERMFEESSLLPSEGIDVAFGSHLSIIGVLNVGMILGQISPR